jgi:acyl-CoA synthetase (AMP-forming)/AMP-acid ligase II
MERRCHLEKSVTSAFEGTFSRTNTTEIRKQQHDISGMDGFILATSRPSTKTVTFFLKGRTDDVINTAGVKYFPAEIEAALLSHPAVADTAVIGGPHPHLGEVSVAYIVSKSPLSQKELHDFCLTKIATYKAPRWIFFASELPRVPVGKPDKKKLREMFQGYLETQLRTGPQR